MYGRLVDNSDWIAKRVCSHCKQEVEIHVEDLLYQRNPNAFWKKECFAFCNTDRCSNRIYISKTFIPKHILDRVPKVTKTTGRRMTVRDRHTHYLDKIKNIRLSRTCKNCKHTNTVTYDKLYINRGSGINPVNLLGFQCVYTTCDVCGIHDELFVNWNDKYDHRGYTAFIEEHIKEYDSVNRCRNIKTALRNAPLALLFYGVVIPFGIATLPITIPVALIQMWYKYGETKDTVKC